MLTAHGALLLLLLLLQASVVQSFASMYTWSICRGNASQISSVNHNSCSDGDAIWYNMSDLDSVRVTPTMIGTYPFATLVREVVGVSMGAMWLGQVPEQDKSPFSYDSFMDYLKSSRTSLYIGGSGMLGVHGDMSWGSHFATQGIGVVLGDVPFSAANTKVTYAAYGSTAILVEFLMDCKEDGEGEAASGNEDCGIAVQSDVDLLGGSTRTVFRTLRASSLFVSNVSIPSVWDFTGFVVTDLYSRFATIAPSSILPIQAKLSVSVAGDWFWLTGGPLMVNMKRHDDLIADCLPFRADCESCMMRPNCKYHPHINGGMCLPEAMGLLSQPALFSCEGSTRMNVLGPCNGLRRSTCVVQTRTPPSVLEDSRAFTSAAVTHVPLTEYRLPLGSVLGRLPGAQSKLSNGVARGNTLIDVTLTRSTLDGGVIALNMSATGTNTTMWRSVGLPYPFFAPNVTVESSLSEPAHSKWCGAPFLMSASCDAFRFRLVTSSSASSPEAAVFVEYFVTSGVVAVHVVGAAGVGLLHSFTSTTLASSSDTWDDKVHRSSGELCSLPNRSTYFVPSYICTATCVHGTCTAGNEGLCDCEDRWSGDRCDVPVGQYNAVNATGVVGARHAECPVCVAGNCTAQGTCSCPQGLRGPRCEIRCDVDPVVQPDLKRKTCASFPLTSIALCSSCACFVGFTWNSITSMCAVAPHCAWDNISGALLSINTCVKGASDAPRAPATHQRPTSDISVLLHSDALFAVLACCVVAVLLSVVLQLRSFRRRRLHSINQERAGPIEGVRRLPPAPQLLSS
jgi:hypothetical protein